MWDSTWYLIDSYISKHLRSGLVIVFLIFLNMWPLADIVKSAFMELRWTLTLLTVLTRGNGQLDLFKIEIYLQGKLIYKSILVFSLSAVNDIPHNLPGKRGLSISYELPSRSADLTLNVWISRSGPNLRCKPAWLSFLRETLLSVPV